MVTGGDKMENLHFTKHEGDIIGLGSEGRVYRLDENTVAKYFFYEYVAKNKIEKIKLLKDMNIKNISKPRDIIYINDILSGYTMDYVNNKAYLGTLLAHTDGKTPNLTLSVEKRDEFNLGYLFYFFEKACGISGYMLEVNPFNQPGVEAYKKNMFALLGKPGYEDMKSELEARLNN